MDLKLGCPPRPRPDWNWPPVIDPRAPMGRGWLQNLETNSGRSVGGFSPLKCASTNSMGTLQKSGETRIFWQVLGQIYFRFLWDLCQILGDITESSEISARTGENLTGSSEISPNPVRSPLDLANFCLKSTILAGFFTVDGFDRIDHFPTQIQPLWFDSLAGRQRFRTSSTRFCWISLGLGTNLTWTDPWTPLSRTVD